MAEIDWDGLSDDLATAQSAARDLIALDEAGRVAFYVLIVTDENGVQRIWSPAAERVNLLGQIELAKLSLVHGWRMEDCAEE